VTLAAALFVVELSERANVEMILEGEVLNEQMGGNPIRRSLLVRYRVMAFTTATLLIILVFAGIPLQVAAGRSQVVNVVGTLHGFLYIAYLFVAFSLTRRLGVPKWQMLLVLLAGTVPFCAFVAERKMTRRFEATTARAGHSSMQGARSLLKTRAGALRKRWISRRALLLHLEVAIVAPGCALAGWWQATRALSGNDLSWVYSVEWPIFALLAIAGWWHLIHEDPEAYRARRTRSQSGYEVIGVGIHAKEPAMLECREETRVEAATARMAMILSVLVGFELLLGIMGLLTIPITRPSGWLPARGQSVYLVHALVGLLLVIGAVALLVRVKGSGRISRLVGWIGFVGVAVAGAGGLLTEAESLVRFCGLALMSIGGVIAAFAYLIPTFLGSQRRVSSALIAEPSQEGLNA
jgi:integral membrane protein